jgi:hypothetical protein
LESFDERSKQGKFLVWVGSGSGGPLGGEALEIAAGDLQGVKGERGSPGIHGTVVESANHLHDGELQAEGVLDHGDGIVSGLEASGGVEAAELESAESRLAARLIVEADMLAERGISEFVSQHKTPL